MDEETARLVFQLQLQDLQEISSTSKGKQRADEVSDFDIAVQCYKEDLETSTTVMSDRHMCMSIARAVLRDGEVINELQSQDEQAAADRGLALQSENGDILPPRNTNGEPQDPKNGGEDIDDELLEKMAAIYVFGGAYDDDHDSEATQPESSSWAANRASTSKHAKQAAHRQCVSCLERFEFYDVTRAPCSHEYCRECLSELFSRSLTDESLFPPRCCSQSIPAETNRIFLSAKLLGEYQAKKLELDTPNRTYCHQPSCSTFIPPPFIQNDVGNCVRCHEKTCIICKSASHEGDCPEDPAVQELLQVATENGWQRCYSCHRLVELRHGCHHMTCLCRAEFCYSCAAPWKTCDCAQWDENRLLERANVVVDRDIGNRILPEQEVAAMVEQARQQLVNDHECRHGSWRRIGGPRRCEECGDRMPIWLNVCQQCNIMVCRRCRYNRL